MSTSPFEPGADAIVKQCPSMKRRPPVFGCEIYRQSWNHRSGTAVTHQARYTQDYMLSSSPTRAKAFDSNQSTVCPWHGLACRKSADTYSAGHSRADSPLARQWTLASLQTGKPSLQRIASRPPPHMVQHHPHASPIQAGKQPSR